MIHISKKLDLCYSHSGCIKLLARLGFEYCTLRVLPRVACTESRPTSVQFTSVLVTELGADEVVYFAGVVHPEYQAKPA